MEMWVSSICKATNGHNQNHGTGSKYLHFDISLCKSNLKLKQKPLILTVCSIHKHIRAVVWQESYSCTLNTVKYTF